MLRSHQQATQYSAHQIKPSISNTTISIQVKYQTRRLPWNLNKAVFLSDSAVARCMKTEARHLLSSTGEVVSEELFAGLCSFKVFFIKRVLTAFPSTPTLFNSAVQ